MRFCFATVFFGLVACAPNYDHDPCEWTGSGFTASHDCPLTLMCMNGYVCPDGEGVADFQGCSGPRCDDDADCRSDHFCSEYSSSQSYCMPMEECSMFDDVTGFGALESDITGETQSE